MNYYSAFDMDDAARMRRDYEQGATIHELAAKYYCNHMTARKYVIKAGGTMRGRGERPKRNIPMILNDWNAGKDTERMAMVYGYASGECLRGMVCRWRKQGWAFRRRSSC